MPQLNPFNAVQVIAQTAIPIIIAPTGTMANNGAITLGTALPVTVANCWLYLPAGAIAAGSAAGFYFTQMSSTTVGVVYNNQPVAGVVPTLPLDPKSNPQAAAVTFLLTPFVTTGPGAYTGATTAINLATITLPPSIIGANGSVRIRTRWGYNNSAGAKTQTITFGGTSICSLSGTTTTDNYMEHTVSNRGIQNSQIVRLNSAASPFGTGTTAPTQATVDTSGAISIVFQATLAVATDFVMLDGFSIEVLPSL